MKFSLWTQYGALNSKPVFDAFRTGAVSLGHACADNSSDSDVDVIWSVLFAGRMSLNRNIWETATKRSKPVIVLEVGGIHRGSTWKVGINGINRNAYFANSYNDGNSSTSRANFFNLHLEPWRKKAEYILLCTQHEQSLQWQGMPSSSRWVTETVEELRKYTDRPILVRPHPRCRLENLEHRFKNVRRQEPRRTPGTYDDYMIDYKNIWTTISWSSNPGVHSVINGVPAIVGSDSLAYDVAEHDLANIENPRMPDRSDWLEQYAWTEYTLEEIASGLPLKLLTHKLV